MDHRPDIFPVPPANPGNNGLATLYDTTATGFSNSGPVRDGYYKTAILSLFFDQAVTLLIQTKQRNSATWRTYNGGGAGEPIAASTYYLNDIPFVGDAVRIQIQNGAAAPTVWEPSITVSSERPKAILTGSP